MRLLALAFCFTSVCVADLIPANYKVIGLEKYGTDDEMFSGFMPINLNANHEGSLFFWLSKQRSHRNKYDNGKNKLVVWLNGGPGCSSMVGMMTENGPFTIHDSDSPDKSGYSLRKNPYSWNEVADVVYVEQPIRTGYSLAANSARRIKNVEEVASDFHGFLKSLLSVFTEYQGVPVFITGESYAGEYIPWIADYIVRHQISALFSGVFINLEGVAIGNGAIDLITQELSYGEYAYSHGLIPLAAKTKFDGLFKKCVDQAGGFTRAGNMVRGDISKCGLMNFVMEAAGNPNEYNTNTFLQYDETIFKPNGAYDRFFNDPEIQEIIHVRGTGLPGLNFDPDSSSTSSPTKSESRFSGRSTSSGEASGDHYPIHWETCNNDINDDFRRDHPISAVPALQFLARHIRVLLYSGEFDLNCNTLGTVHVLEKNEWLGRPWSSAVRALWKASSHRFTPGVDEGSEVIDVAGHYYRIGKPYLEPSHDPAASALLPAGAGAAAGWSKHPSAGLSVPGESFSFLIVRNSGHLLPTDIPEIALQMISRFLNKISFEDVPLPSEDSYEGDKAAASSEVVDFPHSHTHDQTHMLMAVLSLIALTCFVSMWLLRPSSSGSEALTLSAQGCGSDLKVLGDEYQSISGAGLAPSGSMAAFYPTSFLRSHGSSGRSHVSFKLETVHEDDEHEPLYQA